MILPAIRQVDEGMQQFAIATEVCNEVSLAVRQLNRQKFEAVIVDLGLAQAGEILEQVRLSPFNRTAVTFAIIDPARTWFGRDPTGSDPAEFCAGETAVGEFCRPHVESCVWIDRARTAPLLSLSGCDSRGSYPNDGGKSNCQCGEPQRGRHGDR